ncbi:MAG TPA: hypothetical protein VHC22_07360 [Pirellulales bacterium]|nr:hypothetical protein [Pirellulales bacterium]
MSSQPKFLILSNGLRDHVGHYFETSVSVAEAARRQGFRPILATHVECRRELIPAWLETHALFHTDYWMREPPAILDEEAGVSSRRRIVERCREVGRLCRRAMRLIERGAYFLLPPLCYDLGRLLRYCCAPRLAEPDMRTRACAGIHRVVGRLRYGADAPTFEQAAHWPRVMRALSDTSRSATLMTAARHLLAQGLGQELEYGLLFEQDLRRLLAAVDLGPADHVWLGTAHARELIGIRLAVEQFGFAQSPVFHLEFRHAPFARDPVGQEPIESPQTEMERQFLSLHTAWGATDRIRFYTDSARLSEDYETIADAPFGVLPLPFRAELIQSAPRQPGAPVTLAYLGEARDEKGFHWLPDLIDILAGDYLIKGKARILLQSNVGQPQHNPRSMAALRRLRSQPRPGVELLPDEALTPAAYYALASQADVVLLPYLRERYRACTSGVLAETLAAGAAAVVPAGTWLADELPAGCGETFEDFDGFVRSVKRVLDQFASYRAAAKMNQAGWRRRHSPDALVAALVGRADKAPQAIAA